MAYTNLGREMMREGRWAEAIPWFEGALRIDPGLARPHLGIGSAYLELGRREEAEAALWRALAADPDLRPARERLARLRERAGDLDGAIEQWREVVRIAPSSARGHEGLARTLARRGDSAAAERHAAEARRLRSPRAP
jgi:tetratricopeptide (TPR) repeat protein